MNESHRTFVDSLVGQRIGGRYLVDRVLRAGGMGIVALGRHPELEQEVAIKFMRPEFAANTTLAARFLREAKLAARVKSPHFVRIFDFGKLESGAPYLVMEMLAGCDLHQELDQLGAHPVDEAIDYLLQAMVGLAEVHALGIVHRDLKPSNLFLSEAAGTRTIKVLDFGVSKDRTSEASALTSTGNLVGTPHYMAPEQIRESRTADVRSDIWSLGVILYELLTYKVPFGGEGEAIGEVYGLVLHTEPVPLRTHNAALPAGIEEVILRCLRRNPDERFANVGEFADALVPFAATRSLPRVDAIHRALASVVPRAAASDPELRVRASPRPEPATVDSSPAAKRVAPGVATPPTEELLSPRLRPETAMTGASEVPDILRVPQKKRAPWAALGGGAFVVIAVAVGFMARGRAPAATSEAATARVSPESAPSAIVASTASTSTSTPTPTATPTPTPTPAVAATPVPIAPSLLSPTLHHAPPPPPRHAPSASSAAPSAPAPPPDLLLDRK